MFTGGGAGNLPVPQTPTEWLAMGIALLLIVYVVKKWMDDN